MYANAWFHGPEAGASPQGSETPEEFAQAARKTVARGYRGLKFNPFSRRQGWDFYRLENAILNAGVDCVAAVREAVGPDVDLFIDCNGVFNTTGNAVRAGQAITPYNIGFLEEPVPLENFREMAFVRQKVDIPIATGERLFTIFSFQQLLELQAVDIIQPDLCHCGGILEARKIAAIADAHYVATAPHNPNGPIGYAASLQVAACVPNFFVLEQFPAEPWAEKIVPQSAQYRFEDGFLEIPDRPGLGVDFDEEAAAEYPYRPRDLYDLHRPGWDSFRLSFDESQFPHPVGPAMGQPILSQTKLLPIQEVLIADSADFNFEGVGGLELEERPFGDMVPAVATDSQDRVHIARRELPAILVSDRQGLLAGRKDFHG